MVSCVPPSSLGNGGESCPAPNHPAAAVRRPSFSDADTKRLGRTVGLPAHPSAPSGRLAPPFLRPDQRSVPRRRCRPDPANMHADLTNTTCRCVGRVCIGSENVLFFDAFLRMWVFFCPQASALFQIRSPHPRRCGLEFSYCMAEGTVDQKEFDLRCFCAGVVKGLEVMGDHLLGGWAASNRDPTKISFCLHTT